MTTNNTGALTPEQEQRAEALRAAARIVAGTGALFGPSPGVPEDRTFDVQEFARWIIKGDDDGAPADDRHDGPVGAAHGLEQTAADVVRHIVETDEARPNPIAPKPRITYAGADVGEVTNVEETEDGIRVTGTLDEPFGDRIARLLVETGPTTGDDLEEQGPETVDDGESRWEEERAAARAFRVAAEQGEEIPEQPTPDPDLEDGDRRDWHAKLGDLIDGARDAADGPDAEPYPWGRREFRAGFGVEPDRRRTLRRVVPTGYSESRLRYYPETPGSERALHGRAGWALGNQYARFPWTELPAGYGRFIYADEA